MKKLITISAVLGIVFAGGVNESLAVTAIPTENYTVDPGECEGEHCTLHMYFAPSGIVTSSLVPASLDTQTTLSVRDSLPIVTPGDTFDLDINWRGESSAVGIAFYDTPPVLIESGGTWRSEMFNTTVYSCRYRNTGNLFKEFEDTKQKCTIAAPFTQNFVMNGQWQDALVVELLDTSSNTYVPTDKITCQPNDSGTSAVCQTQAGLLPGKARAKLVRTLLTPVTLNEGNRIYQFLNGNYSFYSEDLDGGPIDINKYESLVMMNIEVPSPFPAEMVSYADIEIRDGCTPDLTPAVSGCVDPASGITASWNICGANTGTYAVELEKQTADSWVPVETKQFTGNSVTSTVFDLSAQIEDAVYKYRVKKTDGGGSGQWSSPEVVTIGLAPGNPSVNAPAQASAGTPVNFSWAHAASDITASRIGTSVLNIASTILNGTKTGSAWQTQWVANSTAGDYPYTVTSSHPLGCGDGNASGTVEVTEVANQDPVASLTVTPVSGNTGTAFTADGSASSDPDGTIASYDWQVTGPSGETVAFQIVPGSNGQRITFTGDADGNYSVVLIVTDDRGATDQATAIVTVTDGSSITPTPTSNSDPGDIYEDD
jgi:hypothetical protein